MSIFSNPMSKALQALDANPKLCGWPIWSSKTGKRYYIVPEDKFSDLLERAGYEIADADPSLLRA